LKKQSQFADGYININSYKKGNYNNTPAFGARKNKAKQSQTKPIYSYCVLSAVYCVKEFEKTNPNKANFMVHG